MDRNGLAVVRSGLSGRVLTSHSFHGPNLHWAMFGTSVAGIGLFDGDEVPDYAVGAPGTTYSAEWAGEVQIFSGATHQMIMGLSENIPNELMGGQVIALGDVNGDGHPDVGGIGLQAFPPSPMRIYLGPDGTLYRTQYEVLNSITQPVARYGDYDGDGCDDYLVGAPGHLNTPRGGGRVTLYSGSDGGILLRTYGRRWRDATGVSVCAAGDWDGDGIGDIVAGAPGTTLQQLASGPAGVYVFSGADGSTIRFFDGEEYCGVSSHFGWSVSSNRDVNGDGVPDLLVGAPWEPVHNPNLPMDLHGSAFLFSGKTGGLLWEYHGETGGARAGYKVKLIDDHNGDGLADWAVLAPEHDIDTNASGPNAGRFTIFAGAFGEVESHCPGGPNSVSNGAILWNSGPVSVSENRLELVVSELPQSRPVYLIHGQLAPSLPFGGGELCLGLPIALLTVAVSGSGGAPGVPNSAQVEVDLTQPPFTAGGNTVQPGDTWAFQALYRDQGGRNASNALEARFVP